MNIKEFRIKLCQRSIYAFYERTFLGCPEASSGGRMMSQDCRCKWDLSSVPNLSKKHEAEWRSPVLLINKIQTSSDKAPLSTIILAPQKLWGAQFPCLQNTDKEVVFTPQWFKFHFYKFTVSEDGPLEGAVIEF